MIIAVIIAVLGVLVVIPIRRGEALVRRWASESGYTVLAVDYRAVRRGPFVWTTAKHQLVYHVALRDSTGHEVTGFARAGSRLGGVLLSTDVTFRRD